MTTSTTTYRHPGSTTTPDTVATVVYRHTTPDRTPTVWDYECRHCARYNRPCGRHEHASTGMPRR